MEQRIGAGACVLESILEEIELMLAIPARDLNSVK